MDILAAGLIALIVWVVLLVARGQFWRIETLFEAPPLPDRETWPSVVAIVPARNEAEALAETLPALLRQNYPGQFSLLVVDDQSSDGTGEVARGMTAEARAPSVVRGASPPPGWTGKLWAMQQGLARADDSGPPPDYVLFVDADIVLSSDVLRRVVVMAEDRGAVLVSLMAKLRCKSAAERWLTPAFIFFFRMLYPFAWVNDARRRIAAAAGGCMLVRRQTLREAGDLAALKGALIDDCALAALMKQRGPIWLGLTEEALSLRAYSRFGEFAAMVMRSAFAELRYSEFRLAFVIVAMALVFVAPPLLALFSGGLPQAFGIASWAMMAIAFAPMLRFYRQPLVFALALPVIASTYALFTIGSAVQYWSGRGGQWKGRIQAPTPRERRA
ncbi:MAG: glycosyltransferase [Bradyrhizobium sp.]|nr:MAG: glycosyltransferase [Bradyrhizobium sp.]